MIEANGLAPIARQADALLHTERPGDWNQAMMELGAVVCTPRSPKCGECPVAAWCTAARRVRAYEAAGAAAGPRPPAVTDYPAKATKAPRRKEAVCVRIVEWVSTSGEPPTRWLLMLRRPECGLLAGQWEFPSAVGPADEPAEVRHAALDATLLALGMVDANSAPRLPGARVSHIFSHVKHDMSVELVQLVRAAPPPALYHADVVAACRWVQQPPDGSVPAGLTGGVRKVWEATFAEQQSGSSANKRRRST